MSRLRLYLDEDTLQRTLVAALRTAGFDCLTVAEKGRRGHPDAEQLAYAHALNRVLYTRNTGDFARLHREWRDAGKAHAGVIVLTSQRTPIGAQLRAMTNLAALIPAEAMLNRLEFLLNYA